MMKERSWIVRSVTSVIASMEKSTAWNQSGSAFAYSDIEGGKSDRIMSATYLHRELTGPAIDFACSAWQQWSLPRDCSDTRDRVIKTIEELCLIVSQHAKLQSASHTSDCEVQNQCVAEVTPLLAAGKAPEQYDDRSCQKGKQAAGQGGNGACGIPGGQRVRCGGVHFCHSVTHSVDRSGRGMRTKRGCE